MKNKIRAQRRPVSASHNRTLAAVATPCGRLASNPYGKEVALTSDACARLLADKTECAVCGLADADKTYANVAVTNWRAKAYTDHNTFPVCRQCYKARRGRATPEFRAYAQQVVRHAPLTTDEARARASEERRNALSVPVDETVVGSRKQLEKTKKRFYAYVKRQRGHDLPCLWSGLGRRPKTSPDAEADPPPLSSSAFVSLLANTRHCFYCACVLGDRPKARPTIDRISSQECYTLDNVVVACSTCNETKSNKSVEEFVGHMRRVAAGPARAAV